MNALPLIDAGRGNPAGGALIRFQAGSGCPIFFMAGLGGRAEGFAYLAAQIASRHPRQAHAIYGLNTYTRLGPAPCLTVESLAAQKVAELEEFLPGGSKLILVGHSFGGTVAFEMARQLEQRNTLKPLPVVIDMSAVNAPGRPPRSRSRHLVDTLRNLPPWLRYEAANFELSGFLTRLQAHTSRWVRSFLRMPGAGELDPRIYVGKSQVPEDYVALMRSMFAAMRAYGSKPFEGRVVLLRARVPILSRGRDPYMGWTTVAKGGVERRLIAGKHGDCVSDRHAPMLADVIARYAREFACGADHRNRA